MRLATAASVEAITTTIYITLLVYMYICISNILWTIYMCVYVCKVNRLREMRTN